MRLQSWGMIHKKLNFAKKYVLVHAETYFSGK